ncbi:MAG: S8 family serine peptidase [Salinivirgaceae bacterium]|jgi:serine protease AprX|nr:S8 family serine peptidase [Salinivirgaceae bacterium]
MVETRALIIIAILFIGQIITAQDYEYGYLVEFTDKNNASFSIDNPQEYLSERAIERRNLRNIDISEQDFPVNRSYTDSILKLNAKLHVTSRWLNSAVFLTNNDMFLIEANSCSFVKQISLVYEWSNNKSANRINKWNMEYDPINYGQSYNQIKMCNAQKLHEKGFMGKGIHIAVLDGGFWRANELSCFDSLNLKGRILSHWDFVEGNDNVFDDATHGMAVLSIMGGNLPEEMVGTAPQASYHLFRTENVYTEYPIEEDNWIAAAEAADSAGADIITASLGYSNYDNPNMNHTYNDMDGKLTRITQGAEIAFSKGIFVVNSAGNSGNDEWKYITAPSDGENVLCVGAVDSEEFLASFSSRGPSFDGRTKPDVVAKGLHTTIISSDNTVITGSGTSFSCPVITGMVACLWQALPHYSNAQLLNLIRSYGDRFDNPDNNYGFGVPDFGKALQLIDSSSYESKNSNEWVKMYPNPFNKNLSFQLYIQNEQEIEILLYDAQGVKIYNDKKQMNSSSFNIIELKSLENISTGYYILTVKTQEGIFSNKIVKQ